MGHFKVKAVTRMDYLKVGDRLEESDFSQLIGNGKFIQMDHVEDDAQRSKTYKVKPGVWTINANQIQGFHLIQTQHVLDKILNEFVSTKEITERIDKFFSKFQVYYDHGVEVPKRGILLYGPPGTGKSTAINSVCQQYGADNKTAIVIWNTDKFEAYHIKDFIKTFEYVDGVEKIILVAEDIGGVEIDNVRMKSDSSLLALLDNQEKVFKIPVLIIATTNHPENFLGNLTNRPNRFDDKIEVGYPTGEQRAKLLDFFSKGQADADAMVLIKEKKTQEFSAAHIREIVLRAAIYDKTHAQVIRELLAEIEKFKKAFTEQRALGFGLGSDD